MDNDTVVLSVGQALEVQDAMRRNGVNLAHLKRMTAGDFFGRILAVVEGRAEIVLKATPALTSVAASQTLVVDGTLSLAQMIALGRYDWKNDHITAAKFPIIPDSTSEWEWKLFHFDRSISSEVAKKAIEADDLANPWMVGQVGHLLAFGAKCPEEQRKYPIVALGSVARVGRVRVVPCLGEWSAERRLGLYGWVGGWLGNCRFLAVRRVVKAKTSEA